MVEFIAILNMIFDFFKKCCMCGYHDESMKVTMTSPGGTVSEKKFKTHDFTFGESPECPIITSPMLKSRDHNCCIRSPLISK